MKCLSLICHPRVIQVVLTTLFLLPVTHAARIVVDNLQDNNLDCTLRNAITAANTDDLVGGCASGAGADTIIFDPSILPGRVDLERGQLVITEALRIQGPGADELQIWADDSSRLFFISDFTSGNIPVTLHGLTLGGGDVVGANELGVGGAIFNRENLTVLRSEVRANDASGDGGGLYHSGPTNTATLSIIESTLFDNRAEQGGALSNNNGAVVIRNSTVSANEATRFGGGIFNQSTLTVTNTTLAGNRALDSEETAGGGIDSFLGDVSLSNTIITGSVGPEAVDCFAASEPDLNVANLVEDGSCVAEFSGDPLIGPLSLNGGRTSTHALTSLTSPAVGSASNFLCPLLDQRGLPRIFGENACDIGAFELSVPPQGPSFLFADSFEATPGLFCSVNADCPTTASCTEGICAATIGGRVFIDNDDNGRFTGVDTSTSGAGVTLQVETGAGWRDLRSIAVDPAGFYAFRDLNPLFVYRVRFDSFEEAVFTIRDAGRDDTIDSDVDAFGFSYPISNRPDTVDVTHWAGRLP